MMGLVRCCHGSVFLVVYRERLKLLRWRRRRWRKKINDAEDEWEEDEKFGTKGKSNRWREGDFSTVMDITRDEGDWELINFQQFGFVFSVLETRGYWILIYQRLGVFSLFGFVFSVLKIKGWGCWINGWDFIISKVINGLYNFNFILIFK